MRGWRQVYLPTTALRTPNCVDMPADFSFYSTLPRLGRGEGMELYCLEIEKGNDRALCVAVQHL